MHCRLRKFGLSFGRLALISRRLQNVRSHCGLRPKAAASSAFAQILHSFKVRASQRRPRTRFRLKELADCMSRLLIRLGSMIRNKHNKFMSYLTFSVRILVGWFIIFFWTGNVNLYKFFSRYHRNTVSATVDTTQ